MSLVTSLREELGRLFRFGIVGVASTAVYWFATVALAHIVHMEPVLASLFGVGCSAPVSYFGHQMFSFRVEPDHDRHVVRFIFVLIFTLGVNLALVWLIADLLHFGAAIAATSVAIVIPCLNYVMNKYFVFQPTMGCKRA
ncbi:MAG: GtrA family protein [Methylovirgula sp.]